MPNPTTLTVKVPEGTEWGKAYQALCVAFGYDTMHSEIRAVRGGGAFTVRQWTYSPEARQQVRITRKDRIYTLPTLNPNVLDPEDFHRCGRVLRATFRKELPDGNIQGAVWGRDPDGGRDFDTMIDDCTLQPIEDPNGWTIESIPSLGLTR